MNRPVDDETARSGRLQVPVTRAMHDALRAFSKRTGRPMSEIVRAGIVRELQAIAEGMRGREQS